MAKKSTNKKVRVNWTTVPEHIDLIKILSELHRRSESNEATLAMEVWICLHYDELERAFKNNSLHIFDDFTPEYRTELELAMRKVKNVYMNLDLHQLIRHSSNV